MSDERISAGDAIRQRLAAKGWTQADLGQVIGKTTAAINEVIQGKRAISAEMATLLSVALGETTEYWLLLSADCRVLDAAITETKNRSRLYDLAPVREMIRRGWIRQTSELPELESELKRFFGAESLEDIPSLSVSTRRSGDYAEPLNPAQMAWCFRARQLAKDLIVSSFNPSKLGECESRLRMLAAMAPEIRKVPKILSQYGIRFVVVEPLSGSKIDGAALWIDENSPIIVISVRMDRIDSFWFTLFHEFSHIRHNDGISVDCNLIGEDAMFSEAKPPHERRADEDAAKSLIPVEVITSFIHRVAPFYSRERIIQFAHRIKIHPGIILGQLQHRGEVKYYACRELLVKIRDKIVSTAVVDGWGHSIT